MSAIHATGWTGAGGLRAAPSRRGSRRGTRVVRLGVGSRRFHAEAASLNPGDDVGDGTTTARGRWSSDRRPGWRAAVGATIGGAALHAGSAAPAAFATAPPATSTTRSVDGRIGTDGGVRDASALAPLLERLSVTSSPPVSPRDPALVGDVAFLPAAVALPRTGWIVTSWFAGNAVGIQKQFAEISGKFLANWLAYCTIPIVAGILNWLTNALAVKMIFSPEKYVGLHVKRWPETPAGLFGWQGIVPCKVRKMSTTMVDLMTSRLLDVRAVFGRLDKAKCGDLLEPGIDAIAAGVVQDLTAAESARFRWVATRVFPLVPLASVWAARDLARRHGKALVAEVLGEMQERVPEVWDVKTQVVGAMTRDVGIIVELFQRCGRDEFIFIRRSGLYFGFLFGLVQMLQWLVWDPWWSLAVGGAAVGYATNWLALTLMFSPVNPKEFGPFTLHGAFLRRQAEVSVEFAEMLRRRVLTAELIWREILTDPKTKRTFYEILERKTREQIQKAREEPGPVALAAAAMGAEAWDEVADVATARVVSDLPTHLPLVYAYSDEALDLENTLREKMQGLSGEEFEGVLHPVFQEDELTLILVGAFLGLLAGFAQAAFF